MNMNRLMNVAAAGMTVCALVLTGAVIKREFFPAPPAGTPRIRQLSDWATYAQGPNTMGTTGGRIVVTEFSDFQCPYCARAAAELRKAEARHPGELLIVFRNLPLSFHPHARMAARAAICAGRQQRFGAYHDALFARQDSIGHVTWSEFARVAQVPDSGAFGACLRDSTMTNALLARDSIDADKLGATGTPTLIINDQLVRGAPSGEDLESILRDARKVDGSRVRPAAR